MGRRKMRVVVAAVVLAASVALLASATPASAVSPDVVVSQVYGGGGNSGATLQNDFIELHNRGDAPVSLAGWSVQYASATGATWQVTPLSGTIAPGRYYLVQEAAGAGGTTPLPTPDATGSIAMSATAGKVALVTTTTALACGASCAGDASVRDFVGYGATASSFEGSGPAPGAVEHDGGPSGRRRRHGHGQQRRRLRSRRAQPAQQRLRAAPATPVGLRRPGDPRDRRGAGKRRQHACRGPERPCRRCGHR